MSYKIDFDVDRMAHTLDTHELGENESGWKITGDIQYDYYEWVNYFEANHPDYGYVIGDYEDSIEASSKEAYDHFYKNHPPKVWDYRDI